MNDIYNSINELQNKTYSEMYDILCIQYPINKVKFVMYDLLNYDYLTKEERQKRKDDKFRENVKIRYNNECIISGTDLPCQVCHIVPFNKCSEKEKYDVNNGIILRDDIHTLFDSNEIKIDPDSLTIKISDNIMNNNKRKEYHRFNDVQLDINNISKKTILYLKKRYNN